VEIWPLHVAIPYYTVEAQWPAALDLRTGWIFTALLAIGGIVLRGRATPLGYFLRAMALIHLSAQLWFTFMDPPFSYSLSQYLSGLLVLGVVILLISPMLVATTFFIFDFPVRQKLLLATLLMGHIIVLVPLQAVIHGWIIYRATLLAMPMLYLLFGVLLDMFIYVALYGWGMSWRSNSVLDAGSRRGPAPAGGARPTPMSSPAVTRGPTTGVPLVGLGGPTTGRSAR
jgi:hypothetical protein